MYYFSFSCNKDEYNHITRIRRHIGLGCQYILYKTAFLSKVAHACISGHVTKMAVTPFPFDSS